jgi:hypothetical protein
MDNSTCSVTNESDTLQYLKKDNAQIYNFSFTQSVRIVRTQHNGPMLHQRTFTWKNFVFI